MSADFIDSINILLRRASSGSKQYSARRNPDGRYTLRVVHKDDGDLIYEKELTAAQLNSTLSGVLIEQVG